MKMFIPAIGTTIKLTSPWKFRLFVERRNHAFLEKMKITQDTLTQLFKPTYQVYSMWSFNGHHVLFQLPADIELKVDRIYIKKSSPEYNSVSFFAKIPNVRGTCRFWAKLNDVNRIEGDITNPGEAIKPEVNAILDTAINIYTTPTVI